MSAGSKPIVRIVSKFHLIFCKMPKRFPQVFEVENNEGGEGGREFVTIFLFFKFKLFSHSFEICSLLQG